jgi:hypothetical protein
MPTGRWFSTTLLLLAAVLTDGRPAPAQVIAGNAYTVGGIDVDVSAGNAIEARDQAIREAQRRAVRQLAEQMLPPEDRGRVPPVDDARLAAMVRGVEFANERTTATRYIATLTVVFAADPVKAWLAEAGIRPAETVARATLVIPLWKGRTGLEPIDDRNAWRAAWQRLNTAGSAVPVTVLRGDQLDQDALSVEEAYVGDISALSRLNARYRAPSIVIAIVEGDRTGKVAVSGIRYDTQTGLRSAIAGTEVDAEQLGEAARRMHAGIEEEWRSVAVVRRDSENMLDVIVPIRALADWVQVRQRLAGVPAIKTVSVRTLETERADVRLEYFGSTEQLQQILMQAGLLLARDAGEWRLRAR